MNRVIVVYLAVALAGAPSLGQTPNVAGSSAAAHSSQPQKTDGQPIAEAAVRAQKQVKPGNVAPLAPIKITIRSEVEKLPVLHGRHGDPVR